MICIFKQKSIKTWTTTELRRYINSNPIDIYIQTEPSRFGSKLLINGNYLPIKSSRFYSKNQLEYKALQLFFAFVCNKKYYISHELCSSFLKLKHGNLWHFVDYKKVYKTKL
jgi:hypothetical protein